MLTKTDNTKQVICKPSGSASAEMITFSYLDLLASHDGPIPHPIEFAISQISAFFTASFTDLPVILRILPLKASTACVLTLRVNRNGPRAEFPSQRNISVPFLLREVQSTNLLTIDRLLILSLSSVLILIRELISFLESN